MCSSLKGSIMKKKHQWHIAAQGFGRRFAFGSAVALSLTLVAFEWSTTRPDRIAFDPPLEEDPFFDDVPVFKIERKVEQKTKVVDVKKKKSGGPIEIAKDPEPIADPGPVDPITPDPGPAAVPDPLPS